MSRVGADLYVDDVQILDKSALCAPPNLLPNSNFESGIDGWTGNGATASVTSTWFHSGANSLMGVATSASGYPNLVRDVSSVVQPGKKYQVSVWFSGGASGAYAGLSSNFGCSGYSTFTSVGSNTAGSGTWSQVTGTLDFAACPSSLWWAQLWVGGGKGATYFIDDVSLTPAQ
jgi:endo-1,4-beta-xylanase